MVETISATEALKLEQDCIRMYSVDGYGPIQIEMDDGRVFVVEGTETQPSWLERLDNWLLRLVGLG